MKPVGVEVLHRRDWTVETAGMDSMHELVGAYHYSRGGANSATFRHGLFYLHDWMRCYGVAWWIPPTRDAALASWPEADEVLTLSRLAIDPVVPQNGASFLLARSVRLIRRDGRYRCLLTYADESQGHTGAIYLATGWEPAGETKPEPVWQDAAGRMQSRKRGQRTLTVAEMRARGYVEVGSSVKHRFRMVL